MVLLCLGIPRTGGEQLNQIEDHLSLSGKWPLSAYTWKTERFLDRFVDGLGKKKIFGLKCSNCATIFVPPGIICPRCHFRLISDDDEDWVPISDMGIVIAYSIQSMALGDGLSAREPGKQPIFILVRLDGTDTTIFTNLLVMDGDGIKAGMRVQVAWPEASKGDLSDIMFFKSLQY
jgi:uncharacterized OB-fold protein